MVNGARGARLPDTFFARETHASRGRGNLSNQIGDSANGATVAREIGQAMAIAQLLPQPIVLRQQPIALSGRH
jgi:hypothetical protein